MGELTRQDMKYGHRYGFKHQPEELIYLGYNWSGNGHWHQFAKAGGTAGEVWAEIPDSNLWMIESRDDSEGVE
ncbi:hypothetical protein [uncultured Alcanivorax sp.]|jgi:hypothetical protein|uniref:hypothetical protein n=1 Tax=uncultured Alcanivorax sp. TaxID=191215 RepID=UPI0032B14203